jgi:putative addiction module killer protein
MLEIRQTQIFKDWYDSLDVKAAAKVAARIERASFGNFDDHKNLKDGISEMRIDFGPGYRVYYTKIGKTIYLLLCGGDKDTQQKDIQRAKGLVKML